MKRPIAWHKECLKNLQSSLLRELDSVRSANESCDRTRQEIIALDAKIIEAEMRGLDGFDIDKFGKKRRLK